MSFIRAMSSGVICCIAPLICSKSWLASCWRSRSISSSKRRDASCDSKSYCCSSRTLPARSSGRKSRRMLRSTADSLAVSARRWSPVRSACCSASRTAFSMAWRSSSTMSASSRAISS